MEWTVLFCLIFACHYSIPTVSSLQDDRVKNPEPTAVSNSGTPERERALLQIKDYMDQGDALLKDRLTESYTNLKELLREGDSVLKEQIVESVAQVIEQRKEGDERLKEELDEDVAWLKDKLAKGQTRMKEELAEEETKMKEEQAEQREALGRLKDIVEQPSRSSGAVVDADLKQQMADFQAELNTTKLQLQTTQESLQSTQESLQSTQESLQTTQESLQTTQADLQTTQADLQTTQADLQSTQADLQSTQADLQTTQEKVNSMEQELQRTSEQLQSEVQASTALKTQLQTAEEEILSLKVRVNSSESCCQSLLESSDPSADAPKVSCDDGYELACNRCLKAVAERANYTTARQRCREMQAQLVMAKSSEEIHCLWTHIRNKRLGTAWLGADDMEERGVFKWTDGTALPDRSPLWGSGEPDKSYPGADCVYLHLGDSGLWDNPCRSTSHYICQKD